MVTGIQTAQERNPMNKPKVLLNLPPGFFRTPALEPLWTRLSALADVTRSSCNTPDEIRPLLADKQAVLMWSWPKLDAEILASAPGLRFAGHLNASKSGALAEIEKGIVISEGSRAWSPSVAEMGLALILSGLRRLGAYHSAFRDGAEKWVADFPADIDPRERQLTGRSVGIVGFGGIGQRLAELLGPFHVDLRAFDPYLPAEIAEAKGARLVPLDDLLANSEVVVLAAANTDETNGMIGAPQIRLLRPDALLINICRSSVVDTEALVERLRGGGLTYLTDVFDQEPLPDDSPLREIPEIFGTPHRAGAALEAVVRIVSWLIDDLEAFLAGQPLQRQLSIEKARLLPES